MTDICHLVSFEEACGRSQHEACLQSGHGDALGMRADHSSEDRLRELNVGDIQRQGRTIPHRVRDSGQACAGLWSFERVGRGTTLAPQPAGEI